MHTKSIHQAQKKFPKLKDEPTSLINLSPSQKNGKLKMKLAMQIKFQQHQKPTFLVSQFYSAQSEADGKLSKK